MDTSILAYLAAGVAGFALLRWRLQKSPDTFGSAGWLTAWKASGKRLFRPGGLLLGDWTGLLPIHYRGGGHALTVAPTGSGKGVAAIVPNLLRHPWIFLIDPGGENTAVACRAWRSKGYTIFCLNPWDMHEGSPWKLPAHAFNPLDILDPSLKTFASDADLLADMIVTRSGRENGSTAYFKDEAQSGIRAFLMHIATAEEPARRNLLTLRRYITAAPSDWSALLSAMAGNTTAGGVIARESAQLARREEQAPEEFSAILSTMKQDTNFIEDPVMQRALGRSDADLAALKGTQDGKPLSGCVVSVVMPLEYVETHAAYARLIIGVALWHMQRGPLAKGRVLFVLDEFPALRRVDRILGGLATLRKYRVWLWPVIQNIGQLKNLYGNAWQAFMSNAGMKQFIGAGDLETAQYVSDLCGETTVETTTKTANGETKSEARRPLATAEEVLRLGDDEQIVLIENLKPCLLKKTPYWQRPALRGLFHPNPYHSATPDLDAHAPLLTVWGQLVRLAAWIVRPAPGLIAALPLIAAVWFQPGMNTGGRYLPSHRVLLCDFITPGGFRQLHKPIISFSERCPRIVLGRRPVW